MSPGLLGALHGPARLMHEPAGVFPAVIGVLHADRGVMQIVAAVMSGTAVVSGECSGALQSKTAMLPERRCPMPGQRCMFYALRRVQRRRGAAPPAGVCAVRMDCVSLRAQSQHSQEGRRASRGPPAIQATSAALSRSTAWRAPKKGPACSDTAV